MRKATFFHFLFSFCCILFFQFNLNGSNSILPHSENGFPCMIQTNSDLGKITWMHQDSIPYPRQHSVRKALILSAIIPGAGQFYNHKYWKIGVIVAGGVALFYSKDFNQRYFHLYKNELINREQKTGVLNTDLQRYSNQNLSELQAYYRRNRDLSIIGMVLLYSANIIDAVVDAHLFDFNVNENLSFHIRPKSDFMFNQNMMGGLTLQIKF